MVISLLRSKGNDGVSPVVGVMLMLVVTIIIAAVVSVFASGMLTEVETPSTAVVDYVGLAAGNGVKNSSVPTGFIYEVKEGTLDLRNLEFTMYDVEYWGGGEAFGNYNDGIWGKYVSGSGISNPNQLRYLITNPIALYNMGVRFAKFTNLDADGSGFVTDPIVTSGERFIMFVENVGPSSSVTSPTTVGFGIYRDDSTSGGAYQSGALYLNGNSIITLTDVSTGLTISEIHPNASDLL